MNIYLLEGKSVRYICLANDLLEVEKQLQDRYKWTKNLSISLLNIGNDGFDKHLYFNISWIQYSPNDYKDIQHNTSLRVSMTREFPNKNCLLYNHEGCYY